MSYTVLVDDNFHYMDKDERYTLGEFESLEAAIIACAWEYARLRSEELC
jgi:hypothetical protein